MTDPNCKTDRTCLALIAGALLLLPSLSPAGEADVIKATASCNEQRICSFSVTLRHADTGWEHYANRWDVTTLDGQVLGTRVLYHPHVDEQPFTRSLAGVKIPPGIDDVRIVASDSVHETGGMTATVRLFD